VWSLVWPGASLGGFAVVGATAFLAASMQMPITAVVLVFEFTRVGQDFLIPVLFAVGGSLLAFKACTKWAPAMQSAFGFNLGGAGKAR
jgi:H+/Cl- antiporter ClcA